MAAPPEFTTATEILEAIFQPMGTTAGEQIAKAPGWETTGRIAAMSANSRVGDVLRKKGYTAEQVLADPYKCNLALRVGFYYAALSAAVMANGMNLDAIKAIGEDALKQLEELPAGTIEGTEDPAQGQIGYGNNTAVALLDSTCW